MAAPPPPPGPLPLSRMEMVKLVKYLPKYDGKSDAREFLSLLETEITDHGLSTKWLYPRLPSLFSDQALSWYNATKPKFEALIALGTADDLFWNQVRDDLTNYFSHESQVEFFRLKSRSLKFRLGDDPTSYVTQKLEILKNINRQMSEIDKVRKLIEGIPHELQQQFRLLGVSTHLDFLTKLRVVSESLPKAETINVGPHPSNYSTGASSAPIVSRFSQNQHNPTNAFPPTVCNYCLRLNHTFQNCRKRAFDESKNFSYNNAPRNTQYQPHRAQQPQPQTRPLVQRNMQEFHYGTESHNHSEN
jgi:hypothetical protein